MTSPAVAAITVPLGVLSTIDTRAQLLDATRLRGESALNTYIFTGEAYRQRRTHLIYDGDPPLEEFDESEYQPGRSRGLTELGNKVVVVAKIYRLLSAQRLPTSISTSSAYFSRACSRTAGRWPGGNSPL